MDSIPDQTFGALLKRLPSLKILNLRYILFTGLCLFSVVLNERLRSSGCTKVAAKTMDGATHCPRLSHLNLNYTSVTPLSLAPLLLLVKDKLEVLKVAGISNWDSRCLSPVPFTSRNQLICFGFYRRMPHFPSLWRV